MNKKSMLSVLLLIIFGTMLTLAVAGGRRFPLVNRVVTTIVLPVEDWINSVLHSGDSIRDVWRGLTVMNSQNKMLLEENKKLKEDTIDLVKLKVENEQLRGLLSYKKEHKGQTLIAGKVIARNFGDLRDTIYINIGQNDGIAKDMIVVVNQGLVGIIDEVYEKYSRVLLISSPNCRIGAQVMRVGVKTAGVVHGLHEAANALVMEHIFRDADIKNEDVIVTNGYSGKHPEDILIGKVISVHMDDAGLIQEADVEPYVDVDDVEFVFVVTDFIYRLNDKDRKGRKA